jgi:hypothetical protein
MSNEPKRRGGWHNPASAENAKLGGRPKSKIAFAVGDAIEINGVAGTVLGVSADAMEISGGVTIRRTGGKTAAQYYAITASRVHSVPIRNAGGWGVVDKLRWEIVAGPCATRTEAETHGRTALGPNDAEEMEQKTRHQNFRVVARSGLKKYGVVEDSDV